MAQIPMGPGVARVLPDAGQNRVITPDPGAQNQAAHQLAATVQDFAAQQGAIKNREDQALARLKASNSIIDRESEVKTISSDLAEQLRTGQLPYDKAEDAYNSAVNKLKPLETPGLDPEAAGQVGLSVRRLQEGGLDGIRSAAAGARIVTAKADLVSRMDTLGKDAGAPGANIDQINARMDAEEIDEVGRMAFGPDWTNKKQEFRDQNWSTHATQRVIGAGNDLASLQKVEHDLTAEDGYYSQKLDPEKRTALMNTVTGRIYQVQEHNARQAEMREMKAERALTQMDRQAASGVPPTPADQARWKATVSGTSAAGEFNTRMSEMVEIQGLLRSPLAEQQQYIDNKRQQMATNGGSVTEQANVNRLQTAVDNNTKMMKEQPLTFHELRTGAVVEPLDLTNISSPDGLKVLGEQIAGRFDVVNSVRKQYGPEVARNPWKPAEQAALTSVMANADDATKLQVLSAIAAASPTGSDYSAAIKPLVADQPLTLLAGLAQHRDLKAPDGTGVAKTLMAGSKVLADKSIPQPKEAQLTAAFDEAVGFTMPAGTPQRAQAYQGYKALYAGLTEASGTRYDPDAKEIDKDLSAKAVEMITGGIGERGGAKVIKPYGMSDTTFNKIVDIELEGLATRSKFPVSQLEDMPMSPVPGREGSYYLLNAGRVQVDPSTSLPMIITVGVPK